MNKTHGERLAVCETEIGTLKNAIDRVCVSDIPSIYDKLETLSNFSTETRSFFKIVVANAETLRQFNDKLDNLKLLLNNVNNQEKLGKTEKAGIIVAVITAIASAAVAYLK